MKAYVCRREAGRDVLRLEDVEKPAPKDDELLVKVMATSVTAGDWRVRTGTLPKGFGPLGRLATRAMRARQPILGTELAGVVEAVGKDVTRFTPGQAVLAFPGAKMGGHAQFRAISEKAPVATKPPSLSFEEAASLPFGGTTALHFLRKTELKPAERALVVGASGGVGTMLVQLAKHAGAHVTGVTSTPNIELVASLGADEVIDYKKEDFTQRSESYDVIFDTVGMPYARTKRALRAKGRLAAIAGGVPDMLAAAWAPLTSGRRIIVGAAEERAEDVRHLAELAGAGTLRAVIDRRYDFAQLPEAHDYVATGRKRGSVVVTVQHED